MLDVSVAYGPIDEDVRSRTVGLHKDRNARTAFPLMIIL